MGFSVETADDKHETSRVYIIQNDKKKCAFHSLNAEMKCITRNVCTLACILQTSRICCTATNQFAYKIVNYTT